MAVSLHKPYAEPNGAWSEPLAPAAWLADRENLYNVSRTYRWLGGGSGDELGVLHLGWSGLKDDSPQSYNGESSPGYVANTYGWAPRFVEVPYVAWGDYSGSGVERSNFRCLLEDLAPYGVLEVRGGYGSRTLVLPYGAPVPLHILSELAKLADEYPLWNEEDHSALESELATEAWDDYAHGDLVGDLYKLADAGDEGWEAYVDAVPAEVLQAAFWQAVSDGDEYPYLESAVSVVFPKWDEIVAAVAEILADAR